MKMQINKESCVSNNWLDVENPATNEVISKVPVGTAEDIDKAVASTKEAFMDWKKTFLNRRRNILMSIADLIGNYSEEIARILVHEVGKPIAEARHEVLSASRVFREFATLELKDEIIKNDSKALVFVARRPLGVAGLILPWNYPFMIMAWKLAPAMLAGDTVVIKPSPYTPLNALKFGEITASILPKGVVNIVTGLDKTGEALVKNPDIRKIAFTGHVETGKRIMVSAAQTLKRISLELGGNDPAIILKDFNMKNLPGLFWSAFRNAGQVCIAVKRIYVQENLYQELVKKIVGFAQNLKLGNGLDARTQMGPVNNPEQLQVIKEQVKDALENGGRVLAGGKQPDGPGYFYPPTIVTDVDEGVRLVSEEQFGPVVPIMSFSNDDEVIERANSLKYGLGASVWTSDMNRGLSLASDLESGTAWINTHMMVENMAPFGGFKESGLGRELGIWGLEEYVEMQTIFIRR